MGVEQAPAPVVVGVGAPADKISMEKMNENEICAILCFVFVYLLGNI